VASAVYTAIAGGRASSATGMYSSILGGEEQVASQQFETLTGAGEPTDNTEPEEQSGSGTAIIGTPLVGIAACAAYPKCAGLAGDCCPTTSGVELECCV
jgi:hypothetical protein